MYRPVSTPQSALRQSITAPARLGRPRFTILLAILLAVCARVALPPAHGDDGGASMAQALAPVTLPARATLPPVARPALPTGLALMVDPVSIGGLGDG